MSSYKIVKNTLVAFALFLKKKKNMNEFWSCSTVVRLSQGPDR